MKITALNVHNFVGVRAVEARLAKPVTIFAGPNHSGKSSLQEAIRMALTGESVRVSLKKDYSLLVNDTEKSGFAEIEVDGAHAFVTLPDGKTAPAGDYTMPVTLPYVLDAQRFASLTPDARRTILYGLMGLSADGPEVKARLLAKNCNAARVDLILPMMRSGFDAAHKEATSRAREAKAEWRATTGEPYGEKKAEAWRPDAVPAFDLSDLEVVQGQVEAADAEIESINQSIGAMKAESQRHQDLVERARQSGDLAAKYDRIVDKLAVDKESLAVCAKNLQRIRALAGGGLIDPHHDCPECGAKLKFIDRVLVKYSPPEKDGDLNAMQQLPDAERAFALLDRAVGNGERDLKAATLARNNVAELSKYMECSPDFSILSASEEKILSIKKTKAALLTQAESIVIARQKSELSRKQTVKARVAHESVQAWSRIADALAPDGIPGEILTAALEPLNSRLDDSAVDAGWLQAHVESDMSIYAAYPHQKPRAYSLLSESERWRVDAMLAEAISRFSGLGVLVLDRFDVLDLQGRSDLIAWLDGLVDDGEIQTAILFGTLKAAPTGLPKSFEAIWIDQGVIPQAKQAA